MDVREAIKLEVASLLWNGARSSHDLRQYATPKEMMEQGPAYIRGFIDSRTEGILELTGTQENKELEKQRRGLNQRNRGKQEYTSIENQRIEPEAENVDMGTQGRSRENTDPYWDTFGVLGQSISEDIRQEEQSRGHKAGQDTKQVKRTSRQEDTSKGTSKTGQRQGHKQRHKQRTQDSQRQVDTKQVKRTQARGVR